MDRIQLELKCDHDELVDATTGRSWRYRRSMLVRRHRPPIVPRNPFGQPVGFDYVRWTVRRYEPRRMWLYYLRGGLHSIPYFLPAPVIVVVNATFARGVLLGVVTGLLALIAGPISGFGWSRRVWEPPMTAAFARLTTFELSSTPTFAVSVRQADIDAAWQAVFRAKLIVMSMNMHGHEEFNTTLRLAWPSSRGPVDAETQKREAYSMFLSNRVLARDGDHVIGRDPEID